MRTSDLTFLSCAEKLTLMAYNVPREYSVIVSEVVSRVVAVALLSLAAALDIVMHSLLVLPASIYAIGRSIYQWEADLTLPWQHIQRVRNAVAPLLFGSLFGLLHPFAGLVLSEPTDKHAVLGMLSSNTGQNFTTPCSPIHSLSIVEEVAGSDQYTEIGGVRRQIFSPEHLKVIRDAKGFERSLESLQAQEYIHKITNITLFVMAKILNGIRDSELENSKKEVLLRLSGVLIPVFTVIDASVALVVQAFFLATGIVRLISGRGPIYTEVTTSPLMHVSFLIQNILKFLGNAIGTVVWFVSPELGFKVSLLPANMFFKMQMNILMLKIRIKMHFADNNTLFVVPIVFGNGANGSLSVPTHSMHKTYLIVEKKDGAFNLYWVNRPTVSLKRALSSQNALDQIRSMLDERFPFMDINKMANYPVESRVPEFLGALGYFRIGEQGNTTNCVVSNLFGMLEVVDRIRGEGEEISRSRYAAVRASLMRRYGFYESEVSPFTSNLENYSLNTVWDRIRMYPRAVI